MRKLSCAIIGMAMTLHLFALSYKLEGGVNSIQVLRSDPNGLELRINIAEFRIDALGKPAFPSAFDSHLSRRDRSILEFHLVLPMAGDYDTEVLNHQTRTGLACRTYSDLGSSVLQFSKPYWLRDIRGIDIAFAPIRTHDNELLLTDQLTVRITPKPGGGDTQAQPLHPKLNLYFLDIYKQHFLNFSYRYEDLSEYGTMAVIRPAFAYDYDPEVLQFSGLIQPWVDWKNQQGIPTTVYTTAQSGFTYEEIHGFIQNLYNNDPNLTFVQLIGDFAQVPCKVTTIYGNTGGMDAYYTLLQGDDDYPDVFLGRFSAQRAGELYTQIKRSLEYEQGLTSGSWMSKAAGVCSSNPPLPGDDDEHNWEHLDKIRAQLLDFGYTQVDRVYANEGADVQDLIDCLNSGVSLLNYTGEGYPDHWVEPDFSVSDAEALANTDMLPFIHVVSCWTGQFYDGTCLAEALMRSRDSTSEQARGAIAVYAAAPEQGVVPPMEAQDHAMELLISGSKHTIGGICYNGSCSMIDEYGVYGAYNFLAWNLFGDASLQLRTKPAEPINAVLPIELPPYYANLNIDTGSPDILVSLSKDDQTVVSGFSGPDGIAHLYIQEYPVPGNSYLLTLSGVNRIPVQRILNCYGYGEHAVLDLELLDSEQFIETETEIFKTVRVINRGQTAAANVTVRLAQDLQSQNLVPVLSEQQLGQLLPGETKQTQLSYRVSKGTYDLTTVGYSIWIDPPLSIHSFYDVVHAPTITREACIRSPQINWINPGDAFQLIYRLKNTGSATLKDLHGELSSETDDLTVNQQDSRYLTINPGAADSLVFGVTVSSACQLNTMLISSLTLDAGNAVGSYWDQWMVTDPARTVESFETGDLLAFPWIYQSADWSLSTHRRDGLFSLASQSSAADSIWLSLNCHCLQEAELRFGHDLYRDPSCLDAWSFSIDGVEMATLENSNYWHSSRFTLQEGAHILRWVGKRDPAATEFESTLWLDVIEFPAGTLFENASLASNPDQLQIILAPGEIRSIPIQLQSVDGKYIHYSAVLRKTDLSAQKADNLRIICNKTGFNPGSEELFMFTLQNQEPPLRVKEISLELPEGVIATQASAFMMSGQAPLPFSGGLGSYSHLVWSSETGTLADSLRSAVRLASDANQAPLALPFHITVDDGYGGNCEHESVVLLESQDSLSVCVCLCSEEGLIHDQEQGVITLSANQNLLQAATSSYMLDIYYNGVHKLSLPVEIAYDSDPPGFYDTPHLSNYPNPCRNGTTFAYGIPVSGNALVQIYNLRGQKIRTLVDTSLDKGYHRSFWDATDDQGIRVGSGVYFCRLKVSGAREVIIRCLVLR